MSDKVKIVKIDVDQNPLTPSKFGIMSIPTLLLCKDGEIATSVIGYQPKEALVNLINENI